MSGVIINGVQWEHCDRCGEWVDIHDLLYEDPTQEYTHGRDLCPACFLKLYDIAVLKTAPMSVPDVTLPTGGDGRYPYHRSVGVDQRNVYLQALDIFIRHAEGKPRSTESVKDTGDVTQVVWFEDGFFTVVDILAIDMRLLTVRRLGL